MIKEFFQSRVGIIAVSIIWGLGLATMFRKACEGKTCNIIKYNSPNPDDIKKSYYNYGTGQCYQYEPIITECKEPSV